MNSIVLVIKFNCLSRNSIVVLFTVLLTSRSTGNDFDYTTTKFSKLCTPPFINFLLVKESFTFIKNTS